MNRARLVLRLLGALLLIAGLTASSPGNVGGCNQDLVFADPVEACREIEDWSCRRESFAGRLSDTELEECRFIAFNECEDFVWPAGCRPSLDRVDSCVRLLQLQSFLEVGSEELRRTRPECSEICP